MKRKKQNIKTKVDRPKLILIIVLGLIGMCLACAAIGWIQSLTPSGKATNTARAILDATEKAKPSSTPEPTSTPKPTQTPKPTRTSTVTPYPSATWTPSVTPTETVPPPDAGFIVVSISESANTGDSASARIRTQPGAICELVYVLPSGRISDADGVGKKTADEGGYCFWVWEIMRNTNPGTGSIQIYAGGQSATYPITIK